MTAPLALTMGEPAGIGGELTLLAWRQRRAQALPPFFALDDPARLERLAAALGWPVPLRPIAAPEEAAAAFPQALPVLPIALPRPVAAGRPDPANAPAVIAAIAPRWSAPAAPRRWSPIRSRKRRSMPPDSAIPATPSSSPSWPAAPRSR